MSDAYPKSSDTDITLLLEGTFPFVTGGVSSWVYQLINHLPQYRFAVIFLGGKKSDYKGLRYSLPSNLVHLETHYLFDVSEEAQKINLNESDNALPDLATLHNQFSSHHNLCLGKELHSKLLSNEVFNQHDFLYSKYSWDFIVQKYSEKCPETIFLNYFWSVRNMHMAIWKLVDIVRHAPKSKVIHSISTGYAGFLGALMQMENGTPYILTEHGIYVKERRIDLLSQWCSVGDQQEQRNALTQDYQTDMWIRFFDVLARIAYSTATPIISLFKAYQDEQIQGGAPKDNTLIIPNGVPIIKDLDLRSEINQQKPVIALIGRVVPIKDIKTFIRAILVITKLIPHLEAWIVGPTDEDPAYFEECKELVNVLDLSKKVIFMGQQTISDLLPKIDLVVLSSISEGLPLILLEAFSAGIPVVATNVGACKELIYGKTPEDSALGASGIVVEITNAKELGEAIVAMLQNPKQWKAAQLAGRARVKKYYSQKQFILKYTQVYEKALHSWQA